MFRVLLGLKKPEKGSLHFLFNITKIRFPLAYLCSGVVSGVADQLILFQPKRTDYANQIILTPPDF